MLNRALTFSIIAILFLLALQGVWLLRIIENEKNKLRNQTEYILKDAINKELQTRLQSLREGKQNKNFQVIISNNYSDSENTSKNEVQSLDITDSTQSITKVTS